MKRKILYFILFLTLIFTAGCNKGAKETSPTPTVTPTATPIPKNLAKSNLERLPEFFDSLSSLQPGGAPDYSNGIGYDIDMNLTLDPQITELLELTGLENITAHGTMDIKDSLAMDLTLGLNSSDIINALMYIDSESMLFNLPKYSSSSAILTWSELMGDYSAEAFSFNLQASMELQNVLRDHISKFIDCFKEEEGFTKDAFIGTGTYTITGDKYTVLADTNDMFAVFESFMTELEKVFPAYAMNMEEYRPEENISFVVDYYSGTEGNYAWAAYPENAPEEPLVLVNTPAGFCIYTVEEGTTTIVMSSVASSDNTGIITIPATEEQEEGIIEYEFDDSSFEIYAELDTMEMTMEMAREDDILEYEITMVMEGFSIIIEETVSNNHADITYTIASLGMKLATLSVTMDTRAYKEFSTPESIVDTETWSADLDQNALLTDMLQLTADYPFLVNLFMGSENDGYEDDYDENYYEELYVIPEDYTDDFMGMTGYYADSYGYVDFTPLEDEVLATGKPSTGYNRLAISEDQKQALIDYSAGIFENSEYWEGNYYNVYGSIEYNDVASYYTTEYYYGDINNFDNFIFLDFDAVSGDFITISIYMDTAENALQIANDILKILGVDYTLTAEAAEEYVVVDNFLFSGYAETNYYNIAIDVYQE